MKLENDLVNEQRMRDRFINLAKITIEERKKCELCRKGYI